MFGKYVECYFYLRSETDPRFNFDGKCGGVFDFTTIEDKIKELEQKYGKRPLDLEISCIKD